MASPKWKPTLDNVNHVVEYVSKRTHDFRMPWWKEGVETDSALDQWAAVSKKTQYCDVRYYRSVMERNPARRSNLARRSERTTYDTAQVYDWLTDFAGDAFVKRMRATLRQKESKRSRGQLGKISQISISATTLQSLNSIKGNKTLDRLISDLVRIEMLSRDVQSTRARKESALSL